ncbi:MAG: hypothetical protein KKG09_06915 [Verrucomicrobia bacterium]|nr:hypothetical protein [Verrucomicrobiota bacterium]MCG2680533.1 hypothetical protein [Kiritimatiellia bacterium]MBU4247923.1 hypothetical protein [Verrucomicrobiota bacterium]MBU4289522.1 hypothetical protein [Verrucomicrobiota bacterium]MBU4428386.1 hypothetical protein [Verrucomicrobiota bacterium]
MFRLPPRPIFGWKEIAKKANAVAIEHKLAKREFPLDVEEIVEFDLGIEIRLCTGVLEEFGSPAQIAPGDKHPIITVDAEQYRPSPVTQQIIRSPVTFATRRTNNQRPGACVHCRDGAGIDYCSGLGFRKVFDFIRGGEIIGFYLAVAEHAFMEVFPDAMPRGFY